MITKSSLPRLIAVFGIWVVWGAMYFFTHIVLAQWPPFFVVGSRFVIAGWLLFLFLRLRGYALPTRTQVRNAGLMGVILIVMGSSCTIYAQQWNSSSLASVIAATATIWIAIFSGFVGQWPRRLDWLGIVIGFAGVVVLALPAAAGMRTGTSNPIAMLIALCGTLAWSAGSVLSLKLELPKGPMRTAVQMLVGGTLVLGLSLLGGERVVLLADAKTWGAWAVLVFGSLMGMGSYMFLLDQSRTALATSYAYVNPVVAILLGVFVANEAIAPWELVGISIILISVVFIWLASTKHRQPHFVSAHAAPSASTATKRISG
jgi:drug/metabolite transporter (DMT)-like permease